MFNREWAQGSPPVGRTASYSASAKRKRYHLHCNWCHCAGTVRRERFQLDTGIVEAAFHISKRGFLFHLLTARCAGNPARFFAFLRRGGKSQASLKRGLIQRNQAA